MEQGKGKTNMFTESPMDKPVSLPSLEALLSDPSLFEELSLENPNEEVFVVGVLNVLGWVKRLLVKRVTSEKHVNPYTTRLING